MGDAFASDSESSTSSPAPLDLNPDTEWLDTEADVEELSLQSFFSTATSSSPAGFLKDCKERDGLDFGALLGRLNPDFYAAIKLANFLRTQARSGSSPAQLQETKPEDFADDQYLQPALPDDALLFTLDDILALVAAQGSEQDPSTTQTHALQARVQDLEEQLARLQTGFTEYRAAVAETLDARWSSTVPGSSTAAASASTASSSKLDAEAPSFTPSRIEKAGFFNSNPLRDTDTHYFDSYAYNDIHETMLKDTPRTSSYRDFIYDHKDLFQGKTVLDVGCGTGILSLFAAKAGAKRVFAVDNSNIVEKARQIVKANGQEDVVKVVRGKIEDVPLPFESGEERKVDIIVSEWMGYALLYEAMLNSVLRARDAYLSPQGLLTPSHCSMLIAPVSDPEYVADSVGFWGDVYGFDMRAMTEKIYDDVIVRPIKPEQTAGKSDVFKVLDLHTVRNGDLDFQEAFEVTLDRNVEVLDGFVVWFDTFFLPDRTSKVEKEARAEHWKGKGVAFTTGPGGEQTHWMSGWLMIDRKNREAVALSQGQRISGKVAYARRAENERQIDISVTWEVPGTAERGGQTWALK